MADTIQAWTPNAITLKREAPQAGGWLTVQQGQVAVLHERDRVGKQAANTLFGTATSLHSEQLARLNRLLTSEQLWLVYQRCPDVRAAIDAIVRRVATWDWTVEPLLAPSEDGYEAALAEAADAKAFLQAPNTDGETWQELWTKVCTDLLVFDAGTIENVFDGTEDEEGEFTPGTDLQELVALQGASVFPVVETHGHLLGYRQNTSGLLGPFPAVEEYGTGSPGVQPTFEPRQVVYMRLFPNTSGPLGVPLIETIVNEIITVMRSSEHAMLTYDADEIPPGILVLTGIAGRAAETAKADLQKLRGKDHKVRVITNPDPKATGAHWVELRHTPKDVDFVNVINQVRRTIWRVFGVMPVEMGASEDIPRAVGQVQLEVSGSHLINPILELIEAKVNARILPLVVGDQPSVKFRFDRESKLSADDQQTMAAMLVSLIREGVLSRNEARKIRGDQPVEGGDVMTVTTGQGTFPLAAIVAGPATGVPTADSESPAQPPPPPGEATMLRAVLDDLPSEWQPTGPFRDKRTLDLPALADEVARYRRNVMPAYSKARTEVVSLVRAAHRAGGLTDEAAERLQGRISTALERLVLEWRMATEPVYLRVANLGRSAARDFTGLPVLDDGDAGGATERGEQYGARAMEWLVQEGGMLADLRTRLTAIVDALVSRSGPAGRAAHRAPEGLGPDASPGEAADAAGGAFDAEQHRVDNWSGRLVELATATFVAGMLQGGTVLEQGKPTPVEWWCEWVHVGDSRMCTTCEDQGAAGFRPLTSLPTVPGGDTECRARCRCVLVLWTRPEVEAGTAVPLSGRLE
jgi:hypothetical protein